METTAVNLYLYDYSSISESIIALKEEEINILDIEREVNPLVNKIKQNILQKYSQFNENELFVNFIPEMRENESISTFTQRKGIIEVHTKNFIMMSDRKKSLKT